MTPTAVAAAPTLIQLIGAVLASLLSLSILLAFGALIWKRGVFVVQNETIDALIKRVAALEGCVKDLEDREREYEKERARLEGVIAGKDHAIGDIMEAAIESGGCTIAFQCPYRGVPGSRSVPAVPIRPEGKDE